MLSGDLQPDKFGVPCRNYNPNLMVMSKSRLGNIFCLASTMYQSLLDHVLFANSRLFSKPMTPQDTKVKVLLRSLIASMTFASVRTLVSSLDHTAPYRSAEDYPDLHEYSVTDYTFWLDFLGIMF